MLFNTVEEALDKEFYEIHEENGEKRIAFCGYIYTEGEPGYRDGKEDENLCYRIVEYSGGMDFSLKEYLENDKLFEEAFEVRGNDFIGDVTEEEALEAANNWFGEGVEIIRTELTMDTPVGYYV